MDDEQKSKAGPAPSPARPSPAEMRRERLAKTLRDNLQRRKQQNRARRAGAADEATGLPAAAPALETDQSDD